MSKFSTVCLILKERTFWLSCAYCPSQTVWLLLCPKPFENTGLHSLQHIFSSCYALFSHVISQLLTLSGLKLISWSVLNVCQRVYSAMGRFRSVFCNPFRQPVLGFPSLGKHPPFLGPMGLRDSAWYTALPFCTHSLVVLTQSNELVIELVLLCSIFKVENKMQI